MRFVVLDPVLLKQGVISRQGRRRKLLVVLAASLIAALQESDSFAADPAWQGEADAFLARLPAGAVRDLLLLGSREIFDAAELAIRDATAGDAELGHLASHVRLEALAGDLAPPKERRGLLHRAVEAVKQLATREEAPLRRSDLVLTALRSRATYLVSDDPGVLRASANRVDAGSFDDFYTAIRREGFDLDAITDPRLLADACKLLERKPRGNHGPHLS